jgi:phage regulator Rha-like protein
MKVLVPPDDIERRIFIVRGQKVMLSVHLAELYGVETRAFNQSVKRHRNRFPDDFMFQRSWEEERSVRSQSVILEKSSSLRGRHAKFRMYAFTEQGVAMLSTILGSERAIQVNIAIMRAFVKFREILSIHKDLALKLKELETRIESHDVEIQAIFEAIRQLMAAPEPQPKRQMGFHMDDERICRSVAQHVYRAFLLTDHICLLRRRSRRSSARNVASRPPSTLQAQ